MVPGGVSPGAGVPGGDDAGATDDAAVAAVVAAGHAAVAAAPLLRGNLRALLALVLRTTILLY